VLVNIIASGIQTMIFVEKPQITIVATSKQNAVRRDGVSIRICDIGSGVADVIIHKLFDHFFTAKDIGQTMYAS
jgi:C4-dicarboxylate-specific signal transduction histidine kinase